MVIAAVVFFVAALMVDLTAPRSIVILVEPIEGVAATAVAAVCCGVEGWRHQGVERRWRWLTGAAAVVATAGVVTSVWTSPAAGTNLPTLHPPDLGYLVCYALALAGLLTIPTDPLDRGPDDHVPLGSNPGDRPPHPPLPSRRWLAVTVLDSLLVVGALALLAWELVLKDVLLQGEYSPGSVLTMLGLALGALTLSVTVFLLGTFRRPRLWPAFGLLAAGVVVLAIVAVSYVAADLRRWTVAPPPFSTGFPAAMLLIGLAAVAPARPAAPPVAEPDDHRTNDRPGLLQILHLALPYVPLGAVGLLTLVRLVTSAPIPRAEMFALLSLLVLALARQIVTLWDNARLLARYRASQNQLLYQAFHDPLTGLANRALFNDRLRHAVDRRNRDPDPQPLILLFCDLDNFKNVNDELGHAAGDELLRLIAARLLRAVRRADTVARLGGDEFAILFEGGTEEPWQLGHRIAEAVAAPCELAGASRSVHGSVGLAVAEPGTTTESETLLHQADLAMYKAKRDYGTVTVHRAGLSGQGTQSGPRRPGAKAPRCQPGR
ncbi:MULTISPECIES: GGDEF domain-containing protein [unclassified Pseudofrankia]|uniref:GGDEF domain-containing protein n=1 Tax=unclassified Pseudofrankia TaxID=2994372 RepID=UPI0008D9EDFC|nr:MULTISPECIES: GGDEF domain-containing protein [unclassified Pseudofrankia]MDT3440601.1 GGDEF domain-containing protein [Pseudofrankia sp. BMG5.37]OHV62164.1 diguanylate cyclase [Pseudofrankia sp. BMG5.36]